MKSRIKNFFVIYLNGRLKKQHKSQIALGFMVAFPDFKLKKIGL